MNRPYNNEMHHRVQPAALCQNQAVADAADAPQMRFRRPRVMRAAGIRRDPAASRGQPAAGKFSSASSKRSAGGFSGQGRQGFIRPRPPPQPHGKPPPGSGNPGSGGGGYQARPAPSGPRRDLSSGSPSTSEAVLLPGRSYARSNPGRMNGTGGRSKSPRREPARPPHAPRIPCRCQP